MRIIPALVLIGVLSFFPSLQAQTTPAAEIFGGYSFVSFDAGDPSGETDRLSMHGFGGSVTGNANSWFGIEAEVGGNWVGDCGGFTGVDCSHMDFLVGPRFAFRGPRAVGFVHNLFGVDHASVGASVLGASASVTDNTLAIALGGGADVRANDILSVRIFQFDYITTDHFSGLGSNRQHNFRFQTGLVVTLGRR